ncbi:MAG: VWA domain-containing protein, partial [Thermoanaerobaculia bacterium]
MIAEYTSPFVTNQLHFSKMLRRAGLQVTMGQNIDFLRALECIDLGQRDHVYYASRSLLVTRAEDLSLFDAVFEEFWMHQTRGERRPLRRPQDPLAISGQPFNISSYKEFNSRQVLEEGEVDDKAGRFSANEALMSRRFGDMSSEELEAVKKLIRGMRWKISERRTRRFKPSHRGPRLDLRAILRDAARHGGVPINLLRRSQKVKQRPIIALADVSGSMEKYSRLLLQFLHSIARGLKDVETFAFGTRLTRLTRELRLRNIDRAIAESARQVIDWSGGTRIGESLATFNRRWSRQVLHRGSIVLIISDGCERGDPSTLRKEMRFLQHRCHRLILLNPHLGGQGYQPLVEGMSTALPFVDDFLPIR